MGNTVKTRQLRLADQLTEENAELLCRNLSQLSGVIDAAQNQPDQLKVRYELMEINLASIEQKLVDWGTQMSGGLMNRFVRGWIHFTEENEAQNLRSVPHSCCSIPESKR